MKAKLLFLMVVICITAVIGYLMARDPGYVLLTWEGHTIQTSIWLAIGVILLSVILVHYSVKLLRGLLGATEKIKDWQENRKRSRSQDLTSRGLLYLQEGNFERAEKFLVSGAENHLSPVFNFIGAAKCADKRSDPSQREVYLRQALEIDKRSAQAVDVASAEMAGERGDWSVCLEKLGQVKSNDAVLNLKWRALYHTKAWTELLAILPQLKAMLSGDEILRLETEAVAGSMADDSTNSKSVFKKASAEVKQKAEVVKSYIAGMENEKDAENTLRTSLNKHWQSDLIVTYADLGDDTRAKRIKTAEAWQKQHSDDSNLQYCLGKLYQDAGDAEKAKRAYEKSVALDNHGLASQQLAGLLAFEGNYQQSNEVLRLALKPS